MGDIEDFMMLEKDRETVEVQENGTIRNSCLCPLN
jgi:hypothetical protein